jgi:hypothetical protein
MTSATQACGSTSFVRALVMRLYITAARWPPRSEPQNSALGSIVRKTDAPVVEEPGEGGPTLKHIVHGLGDVVGSGELRTLLAHLCFQICDQRGAALLADSLAVIGTLAIDRALDLEQPVDAPDGPERQG